MMTILVLFLTTGGTKNADTYIYHAQSIRWIEEYRVIKGLGVFFNRLSYNSNWFVQNALFSFAWVNGKSFHVLNGFLLWMANSFWLLNFSTAVEKQSVKVFHWVGLVIIVVGVMSLGSEAPAPSTDLPTAYLAWLAAFFLMEFFYDQDRTMALLSGILLLTFAGVVKISIAPVFLMAGFVFLWLLKEAKWREIVIILISMAFLMIPWMIRNVIVSGYLIYPVAATGVSVEWGVPEETAIGDARTIQAWGYHSRMPTKEVFALTLRERINVWFYNNTRNQQAIFLISLGSPVLLLAQQRLQYRKRKKDWEWFPACVFISFYFGLLFWMVTSPNLRFGYVYLLFLISVGFSSLMMMFLILTHMENSKKIPQAALVGMIVFLLFILQQSYEPETIAARLVTPRDYSNRSTVPCEINDGETTIFCASDYGECSYHDFPCHAWGNDQVRLMGNEFLDGFILEE